MPIITTHQTWIAASWTDGDERTVYIEGDYMAVVVRNDDPEYGTSYRATVTAIGPYGEELEVAQDLLDDAEDARDWAEQIILTERA